MARQIKQLDELMDGALTERFNREMDRVLQNVFDQNTDPKAKRQIQIIIEITPNKTRDVAEFKVDLKTKTAPPIPLTQMCFLYQNDAGDVTAAEVTKEVPGQMDMDGGEQPLPRVVEFGKSQAK